MQETLFKITSNQRRTQLETPFFTYQIGKGQNNDRVPSWET